MSYQHKATETFWKRFYRLSPEQKESTREAWKLFKQDPFDPKLHTHQINALSGAAKHTIYSVVIEDNLRVIFRIDGDIVTTLDIGTHDIYK